MFFFFFFEKKFRPEILKRKICTKSFETKKFRKNNAKYLDFFYISHIPIIKHDFPFYIQIPSIYWIIILNLEILRFEL